MIGAGMVRTLGTSLFGGERPYTGAPALRDDLFLDWAIVPPQTQILPKGAREPARTDEGFELP
jgi:hypothetical protein